MAKIAIDCNACETRQVIFSKIHSDSAYTKAHDLVDKPDQAKMEVMVKELQKQTQHQHLLLNSVHTNG